MMAVGGESVLRKFDGLTYDVEEKGNRLGNSRKSLKYEERDKYKSKLDKQPELRTRADEMLSKHSCTYPVAVASPHVSGARSENKVTPRSHSQPLPTCQHMVLALRCFTIGNSLMLRDMALIPSRGHPLVFTRSRLRSEPLACYISQPGDRKTWIWKKRGFSSPGLRQRLRR